MYIGSRPNCSSINSHCQEASTSKHDYDGIRILKYQSLLEQVPQITTTATAPASQIKREIKSTHNIHAQAYTLRRFTVLHDF